MAFSPSAYMRCLEISTAHSSWPRSSSEPSTCGTSVCTHGGQAGARTGTTARACGLRVRVGWRAGLCAVRRRVGREVEAGLGPGQLSRDEQAERRARNAVRISTSAGRSTHECAPWRTSRRAAARPRPEQSRGDERWDGGGGSALSLGVRDTRAGVSVRQPLAWPWPCLRQSPKLLPTA